ncbi:hypothetical protein N7539_009061 [Penicillium diatomitis]|uniref:Uncharacterized protein n=1 Tax=Penicillium diatomitis TaxID=2819901 RepID=A0A9W9WLR1_9EURO|nr:uncharacterized protein N7539_009061 [Penicillium diatomitis]KAJ5469443.1 hypothetical protein N7539_009061 [Penicillium diatomitis]
MMATKADPDVRADVDLMVLDYLATLAIGRVLTAAGNPTKTPRLEEEVDWQVRTVKVFHANMMTACEDIATSSDLEIKLQILEFVNEFWNHPGPPKSSSRNTASNSNQDPSKTSAQAMDQNTSDDFKTSSTNPQSLQLPLGTIGLDFLELCDRASAKVSPTRWFDLGARFVVQSELEDYPTCHDGMSSRAAELFQWLPRNPDLKPKWVAMQGQYVLRANIYELEDGDERNAMWEQLKDENPFDKFRSMVIAFVDDLMDTLDPPVLLQLECGKLGSLTEAETRELKERIGMR